MDPGMITLNSANVQNAQQIAAVVTGPDEANRLFLLDGRVNCSHPFLVAPATQVASFGLLLGPVLTRRQFIQASGSVSLAGFALVNPGPAANLVWQISQSDADWNDESQQVMLRFEVAVTNQSPTSGTPTAINILCVAYHVTILAQL
jgi:hypothetical protein